MSHSKKKVLVVGATGMLGSETAALLQHREYEVVEAVWPPDHQVKHLCLDITNAEAVKELIDWARPEILFNCSAYTDVDGAETQEDLAREINGRGVGNLAQVCRDGNIFLVHVSTDYVFDGKGNCPYKPNETTSPQTAYGRSKLAGEEAIQSTFGADKNWLIVRTSWLFGRAGKNFVDTILKLAAELSSLKVVHDQIGCPTYAVDLAVCLADLAEKQVGGIYHFCNPPSCSWYDLAREAITKAGIDCQVSPCGSDEYPRPAKRPSYSVLDCRSTFEKLGWTARPWQEALAEHLNQDQS